MPPGVLVHEGQEGEHAFVHAVLDAPLQEAPGRVRIAGPPDGKTVRRRRGLFEDPAVDAFDVRHDERPPLGQEALRHVVVEAHTPNLLGDAGGRFGEARRPVAIVPPHVEPFGQEPGQPVVAELELVRIEGASEGLRMVVEHDARVPAVRFGEESLHVGEVHGVGHVAGRAPDPPVGVHDQEIQRDRALPEAINRVERRLLRVSIVAAHPQAEGEERRQLRGARELEHIAAQLPVAGAARNEYIDIRGLVRRVPARVRLGRGRGRSSPAWRDDARHVSHHPCAEVLPRAGKERARRRLPVGDKEHPPVRPEHLGPIE